MALTLRRVGLAVSTKRNPTSIAWPQSIFKRRASRRNRDPRRPTARSDQFSVCERGHRPRADTRHCAQHGRTRQPLDALTCESKPDSGSNPLADDDFDAPPGLADRESHKVELVYRGCGVGEVGPGFPQHRSNSMLLMVRIALVTPETATAQKNSQRAGRPLAG